MGTRVSVAAKRRRPKERAKAVPSEALFLQSNHSHTFCVPLLYTRLGVNSLVTDDALARHPHSTKTAP